MKTVSLFSILALASLVLTPLVATPAVAQDDPAAAVAAPRTGVRFVIISPSGDTLPSPLYCKQGKSFTPVRIGARTPSVRLKPESGGILRFWKENPVPEPEADAAPARGARRSAAVAPAKLPEPFMTVKVPENAGAKTLGILVPSASGKAQTFFVDEKDVPLSGVHLINFSPYPLQMLLSRKGDFSDKVVQNVSFFRKDEGVSEKNRWSYKGENGECVAFALMCKTGKDKEFQRVRASRFSVSGRQSQITVVVKEPGTERVKMLSIQLTDAR